MRTVPALGSSVVVSTETVVVLPAPLGPSSANSAPGCTAKDTPSTAGASAWR